MEYIYAILNEENICVGLQSGGYEINESNLIRLESFDNYYIDRKYENGVWSSEKFNEIPLITEENEFEKLKKKTEKIEEILEEQEAALIEIVEMIIGGNK